MPKWRGGSDTPDNWQFICANCHEDKSKAELRTPEWKEYIASKLKGIKRSPETRAKMSQSALKPGGRRQVTASNLYGGPGYVKRFGK